MPKEIAAVEAQKVARPRSMDEIAASMIVPQEQHDKEAEEQKRQAEARSAVAASDAASSGGAADAANELGREQRRQPAEQEADRQNNTDSDDNDDEFSDDENDVVSEEKGRSDPQDDDDPLAGIFDDDDANDDDRDHERGASTGDDEAADAPKLGDDVKLSVTVDGEDVQVTLGELKRRYAGEGAIEKRLQAATETRTRAVEDYERGRQLTEQVFQQFGQMMFRRTVPEPAIELLNTNPAQYMRQKALFDQESKSIGEAQARIYEMTQQLDEQYQQVKQQERAQAAAKLREIMPVFADPVKGPKVKQVLIETAREIGYTDADIAACVDPLMFKTMALAARELRRNKAVKAKPAESKLRTLAKVSRPSQPVDSNKKREQEALRRAKKTGDLNDIAASMIVQPKRRQRTVA